MSNLIEQSFIKKILSENFSCIGAKASMTNASYEFCLLEKMGSEKSTHDLYMSLQSFAQKRQKMDKRFASFIACFSNHAEITPNQFEHLLWKQLYLLHQHDEFEWDNRVSDDINNPYFSFSIAGEAYFVTGMCPDHPRKCREFSYPVLVFNSHDQFKYLKKINLFEKIKKIVRLRELKYNGSINPNAVDFGEQSEALQYSGLRASKDWQCPFRFDKKGE
jgi:FPC/CPF motif-containing protein YcgG